MFWNIMNGKNKRWFYLILLSSYVPNFSPLYKDLGGHCQRYDMISLVENQAVLERSWTEPPYLLVLLRGICSSCK